MDSSVARRSRVGPGLIRDSGSMFSRTTIKTVDPRSIPQEALALSRDRHIEFGMGDQIVGSIIDIHFISTGR